MYSTLLMVHVVHLLLNFRDFIYLLWTTILFFLTIAFANSSNVAFVP